MQGPFDIWYFGSNIWKQEREWFSLARNFVYIRWNKVLNYEFVFTWDSNGYHA